MTSLSKTQIVRLGLLAGGVGLLAGVAAGVMLWLMQRASALVWSVGESSWYILAVAIAGGVLIGVVWYFLLRSRSTLYLPTLHDFLLVLNPNNFGPRIFSPAALSALV